MDSKCLCTQVQSGQEVLKASANRNAECLASLPINFVFESRVHCHNLGNSQWGNVLEFLCFDFLFPINNRPIAAHTLSLWLTICFTWNIACSSITLIWNLLSMWRLTTSNCSSFPQNIIAFVLLNFFSSLLCSFYREHPIAHRLFTPFPLWGS